MNSLRYILAPTVPLLLVACITSSKSLGAGESTGESETHSSAEDTVGEPACAPDPEFTCTVPYDGVSFGACGGNDFDDDCCGRPTCTGDDDCAAGESCADQGSPGLACADEDVDGTTVCSCSADPGGLPRKVCLPDDSVALDWCATNVDEASCAAAERMELGPDDVQSCRWLEVEILSVDAENGACGIAEPQARCVTIRETGDAGCADIRCGLAPDLALGSPVARAIDDTTFEVVGTVEALCGIGDPIGGWIPASDASLGPCSFGCGPCEMPFPVYVRDRTEDFAVTDCGHVTQLDPLAEWQAAHDCALQQATAEEGFRVIADAQGIDTIVQYAFIGLQGESYATARLFSDSGGVDPTVLDEQPGTGLAAIDDCEVAVGELCLGLTEPGAATQICPQ